MLAEVSVRGGGVYVVYKGKIEVIYVEEWVRLRSTKYVS